MSRKDELKQRSAEELVMQMRNKALTANGVDLSTLPRPIRQPDCKRLVKVYVEGYEDVSFWRSIFDHFTNPYLRFEISVPTRDDLPKGKKVLLSMADSKDPDLVLCMDSDFDYLLYGEDDLSRRIVEQPNIFHTYVYSIENYLCYAPSLHNVCVKATKNDMRIFSFEKFLAQYSRTIYPLFLWYVFSASVHSERVFTLSDFRAAVRIGYLEVEDNGAKTIKWLKGRVQKQDEYLRMTYPEMASRLGECEAYLTTRGVRPELTYLFMQGHTLFECVVMVMLECVCDKLRQLMLAKIALSSKKGEALENEIANYNNSLRSIKDVLLDNENYTSSPLYMRLESDIQAYIDHRIADLESSSN